MHVFLHVFIRNAPVFVFVKYFFDITENSGGATSSRTDSLIPLKYLVAVPVISKKL